MTDQTIKRVVAEAALAKRFETDINERASLADIPALVEEVEKFDAEAASVTSPIALDTDGTPYITIGDS